MRAVQVLDRIGCIVSVCARSLLTASVSGSNDIARFDLSAAA
jgi:hypothetical protein